MATAYMRPDGTLQFDGGWSVVGASEAHLAVDDDITQPTTVGTNSDHLHWGDTAGTCKLSLRDLSGVLEATDVTLWVCGSGSRPIGVELHLADGTAVTSVTVQAVNDPTWFGSTTASGSWSQEQLAGMYVTSSATSDTGYYTDLYVIYVEVTYTPITVVGNSAACIVV